MAEACWATGAEPDAGNPFTGFFDFIEMAYSGEGQDVCSGCLEALQPKHPSQPGDKIRVIAGWMAPGFLTDLLPPEKPSGEEPSV